VVKMKKKQGAIQSTTHFSDSLPRARGLSLIAHRKKESIVKVRAGIVNLGTPKFVTNLQSRKKMGNRLLCHASGACGHKSVQE
jgi:hypothetical protein